MNGTPTRTRGLVRMAAAVAVAAALSSAAPAAAQYRGGDAAAPRPTTADPGPSHVGPTQNLTTVGNRLVLKHRSVTTQLQVLPGSAPTAPVMINVTFPGQPVWTQQYSAIAGNRFLHHFPPLDGMPRRWDVTFELVEQRPSGNISWKRILPVDLVPEFDISVSPLSFTLLSDCDWAGNSEPHITWFNLRGQKFEVELSMDGGETRHVSSFGGLFEKVTAYDGLLEPSVSWYEADFSGAHLGPSPGTTKLFPGGSHSRTWDAKDPDCTGRLSYTVAFHTWNYPIL